jgi:hypothetical protein
MLLKKECVTDRAQASPPQTGGHASENEMPFALGGTGSRGTKSSFSQVQDNPPQQHGVYIFAVESRESPLSISPHRGSARNTMVFRPLKKGKTGSRRSKA